MRVRFTETALDEVEEILSYIAQHNPSAAVKIADAITQAIARAAERPKSSPVVYDNNVRAKLVGRFQYRVYYIERGDELNHPQRAQHAAPEALGRRRSIVLGSAPEAHPILDLKFILNRSIKGCARRGLRRVFDTTGTDGGKA